MRPGLLGEFFCPKLSKDIYNLSFKPDRTGVSVVFSVKAGVLLVKVRRAPAT